MKILRLLSYIAIFVVFFLLLLGNLLYNIFRTRMDGPIAKIEFSESELAKLHKNQNPIYNFFIYCNKSIYSKFEPVKIYAQIIKKSDSTVPVDSRIKVEFYNNSGQKVKSIAGEESLELYYNKNTKLWVGFWYPSVDYVDGDIRVVASGYLETPQVSLTAQSGFVVRDMESKFRLRKGMAFLGIDSIERISMRSLLTVGGKEADWSNIPDWLDYVSADGILMLSGITKTFLDDASLDSPWDRDKISETTTLAERIRKNGKHFGSIIKALKVEGIYAKKMGYETSSFLQGGRMVEDESMISMRDENRKRAIKKLYSTFMENENISYIGLADVILPQNYGIELMEAYFADFQIPLPNNWTNYDNTKRFEYFMGRVGEGGFNEVFRLWKEYHFASYIRDIVKSGTQKKPVFYYLDHKQLVENPHIIQILFNSGIDFVVLNFNIDYASIVNKLEDMKKMDTIAPYFNRIIVSYYMDYKNTDVSDFGISAIENYVTANHALVKFGSDYLNANGIMINDLYKAMFGKRGPYSPYEWMLGVGETIYKLKDINNLWSINIDIFTPYEVEEGKPYTAQLRVKNISTSAVGNFSVEILPILGMNPNQSKPYKLSSLNAGDERTLELNDTVAPNTSQFVRKKNFIGLRISWEEGPTGNIRKNGFVVFRSVKVTKKDTGSK